MRLNNKTLIGFALILVGVLLFFGGGSLWGIIGSLIPLALIYYGAKIYKDAETNGVKIIGGIMVVLGIISLVSMVPFLISLVLSIICVYLGWKMIKKSDDSEFYTPRHKESTHPIIEVEKPFDREWNKFVKEHDQENKS